VGAALAEAFLEHEWIARVRDSRALTVTPGGRKKLTDLGVIVDPLTAGPHTSGVSQSTRLSMVSQY
jgi:hypothetical protein